MFAFFRDFFFYNSKFSCEQSKNRAPGCFFFSFFFLGTIPQLCGEYFIHRNWKLRCMSEVGLAVVRSGT